MVCPTRFRAPRQRTSFAPIPLVRPLTSWLLAGVLASGIGGTPARAETPAERSTEELYTEGQRAFEAKRYDQAGDLWTRSLRSQPESRKTSATRSNIVDQILLAYIEAYRADHDAAHLRRALETVGVYEQELGLAYGAAWQLPPFVATRKGEVERLLQEHSDVTPAEPAATNPADATEPTGATSPAEPTATPDPARSPGPREGQRLFQVGLGLSLAGVAAAAPAIWGTAAAISNAKTREKEIALAREQGVTQADLAKLEAQGWTDHSGSTVALAAGLASATLVIGGVTLMLLGHRKSVSKTAGVVVSPTYVGSSWVVRF